VTDAAAHWRVTPAARPSAGKATPYAGYELQGRARATLVGGDIRHEHG
jgi:dihydroorotase